MNENIERIGAFVDTETDSEDTNIENTNKKRKQYKKKEWILEEKFGSAEEAKNYITSLKIWSFNYKNYSANYGLKVYYRCNQAKLRGVQCDAALYLLYHSDEQDAVSLFKTTSSHTHNERERGLSDEIKNYLVTLFKSGITKPDHLITNLRENKMKVPEKSKIKNFLAEIRKKNFGPSVISFGELEQYCINNSSIPEDDDEPFVVDYEFLQADEYEDDDDIDENFNYMFRFFISTKRLILLATKNKHIHADGTYKLIWQGFPVLMVGTTDQDHKYHPFGLAVCTNEKTKDYEFLFKAIQIGVQKLNQNQIKPTILIADAADAIANGFKLVFGSDIKRIMCWYHMNASIEKKINEIDDKTTALAIFSEIKLLQTSYSTEVFNTGISLFFKKYADKKQTNESVLDFFKYFKENWIEKNNGWYEGFVQNVSSTNNSLEGSNNALKGFVLRERTSIPKFFNIAKDKVVKKWSLDRDPNYINYNEHKFSVEPTISNNDWISAYQWATSSVQVTSIVENNKAYYYIPSTKKSSNCITDNELCKYIQAKWTTFDQFKKSFLIKCMYYEDDSNWKSGKCNCSWYLKNNICKHIIGMSIRLKKCKAPATAKNTPIGHKPARGRPSKCKKALIVQ